MTTGSSRVQSVSMVLQYCHRLYSRPFAVVIRFPFAVHSRLIFVFHSRPFAVNIRFPFPSIRGCYSFPIRVRSRL
jgi:hypothetical protein